MFNCFGFNYAKTHENDLFECQTGGLISNSIVQNWTPSALECYMLKGECAQCPIKRAHYSFKCQMKQVVDVLIETQGLPEESYVENTQISFACH